MFLTIQRDIGIRLFYLLYTRKAQQQSSTVIHEYKNKKISILYYRPD